MTGRLPLIALVILLISTPLRVSADGGFFSSQSVAISADQYAILARSGKDISMTITTGYTGDGEGFSWVIPTPAVPLVGDVLESGEEGFQALDLLGDISSPIFTTPHTCFAAGTPVVTPDGLLAIEDVDAGTIVAAWDSTAGMWSDAVVARCLSHDFSGELVEVRVGGVSLEATGNHPFFVSRGETLISRPLPADIPAGDRTGPEEGRWVEARDLRIGDVLFSHAGGSSLVTGLSTRRGTMKVYNLEVEECHTYAVGRQGFLVHNKLGEEAGVAEVAPMSVTVHGVVLTEHYTSTILDADTPAALLDWLKGNGYSIRAGSSDVIEEYIRDGWSFVAVKLNPGEYRQYKNELLPPLTIRYRNKKLYFPLRISSISTAGEVSLTLYVIGSKSFSASPYQSTQLIFDEALAVAPEPVGYVEDAIRRTLDSMNRPGLAILYSGNLRPGEIEDLRAVLPESLNPEKTWYLTRMESRMGPEAMTDDIRLEFDSSPKDFHVRIEVPEIYAYPMITASMNGDLDAVDELVNGGTSINSRDEEGRTALSYALENGHQDIFEYLLDHGAEVRGIDDSGLSVLTYAVVSGSTKAIPILVEKGVEIRSEDFVAAAWAGDTRSLKVFHDAGVDLHGQGYYREYQQLHDAMTAAISENRYEVIEMLLDWGFDVETKGTGIRPLAFAARRGSNRSVRMLIAAGADVDGLPGDNTAPIHNAIIYGRESIVRLLIDAGADLNVRNKDGETLLDFSRKYSDYRIIEMIRSAMAGE